MHVSDDLYLGGARTFIPGDASAPQTGGLGIGPLGRVYVWDTVPAAAAANNIALAQTPAGAGNIVLTAGAGVTNGFSARGERVLILDVPRAVTLTAAGNETGKTLLVTGYDQYGQKVSESLAGPNASTTVGKKAFKQILSAFFSAAGAGNINLGTNDILGLPVRVDNVAYLLTRASTGALNAFDAGTLVAADAAAATATTGDVRGTYDPAVALNGTNRVVAYIFLTGLQAGPNATRDAALGVTQNLGTQ